MAEVMAKSKEYKVWMEVSTRTPATLSLPFPSGAETETTGRS